MFEKMKAGLYTTTLYPQPKFSLSSYRGQNPRSVLFISLGQSFDEVSSIWRRNFWFWLWLWLLQIPCYITQVKHSKQILNVLPGRFSDFKLTFQIIQTWMLNLISVKLEQQDKSNSCTNTRVSNMMDIDISKIILCVLYINI